MTALRSTFNVFPLPISRWVENPVRYPIRQSKGWIASSRHLNPGPACKAGAALPVAPPIDSAKDRDYEPQQGVGKINPDSILHALNGLVSFGVLLDVHASEHSKDCYPENEEDQVPDRHPGKSQNERDQVDQGRED